VQPRAAAAPDYAAWLISAGTRPEIVKLAPVWAALQQRGAPVAWVHTGQHGRHDPIAEGVYRFFGITPDHTLTLPRRGDNPAELHALLLDKLTALFGTLAPLRGVIVQGDTTSTLAAAQAAFFAGVPVAHVEAGLRTHDLADPFPEEMNRVLTAQLARWHFAPTAGAVLNLQREGVAASAVHRVGNTVVDAAQQGLARLPPRGAARPGRRLLVTAHRRENWGAGLTRIARALVRLRAAHDDLSVLWPLHGNPAVADTVQAALADAPAALHARLQLVPPLDYPGLLQCLREATLVLTDSGGLQEECAALSVPVAVLRASTERPELIDSGGGVLLGTDEDRIVAVTTALLADPAALQRMRAAANPFGDGRAAERIAAVLLEDAAAAPLH
jgi:UDP-N-acetylglucosamine 2-epimerase (non-hydrolysing)